MGSKHDKGADPGEPPLWTTDHKHRKSVKRKFADSTIGYDHGNGADAAETSVRDTELKQAEKSKKPTGANKEFPLHPLLIKAIDGDVSVLPQLSNDPEEISHMKDGKFVSSPSIHCGTCTYGEDRKMVYMTVMKGTGTLPIQLRFFHLAENDKQKPCGFERFDLLPSLAKVMPIYDDSLYLHSQYQQDLNTIKEFWLYPSLCKAVKRKAAFIQYCESLISQSEARNAAKLESRREAAAKKDQGEVEEGPADSSGLSSGSSLPPVVTIGKLAAAKKDQAQIKQKPIHSSGRASWSTPPPEITIEELLQNQSDLDDADMWELYDTDEVNFDLIHRPTVTAIREGFKVTRHGKVIDAPSYPKLDDWRRYKRSSEYRGVTRITRTREFAAWKECELAFNSERQYSYSPKKSATISAMLNPKISEEAALSEEDDRGDST